MTIPLKTAEQIEGMRIAGRLTAEVLDMLTPHVRPGVTTEQLDRLAHDHIVHVQRAIPAPLNYAPAGYAPYPKSICTSINHQVCHGIPNERALKNGDIVNIDVTVIKAAHFAKISRAWGKKPSRYALIPAAKSDRSAYFTIVRSGPPSSS